jgi:RNA ligase (TIGR02306 family)
MVRHLVTIQKITEIFPIEGADKIEACRILGWVCVIGKGEYKVNDLVVYAEVDSVFPEDMSEVAFLKDSKWRIRTRKFKSQISQGLVLPLSILNGKKFPDDTRENPIYEWKEGQEVTSLLGVQLYIPYIPPNLAGEVKGVFPGFLMKSDQTRIQCLRPLIEKYKGTKCAISEKLDGCLHYRTYIKTEEGIIHIGNIVSQKKKVKVLCYNHSLDCVEYKPVKEFHMYPSKGWMRIGFSHRGKGNREKFIECSTNHKFWTGSEYKEARELKVGENCFQVMEGVSEEVKQMVLGCLLGDSSAHLRKQDTKNYFIFAFGHSTKKQNDYFELKKRLLGNLFSEQKRRISGFGSIMRRGILKSNYELFNFISEYCLKNKKRWINEKWLNYLSPMAIAFWYMDDGSISHREELKQKPKSMINTQRYSLQEVKLMQKMFYEKYNLNCSIGDKKTYKGYVLLFDTLNSERFFDLIFPYVPASMKYKLPLKYEKLPCVYEKYTFENKLKILPIKVLSIKKDYNPSSSKLAGNSYMYDLTIEGNHNYFANGVLTHNSSVTCFIKDGEFGVCSRNLELKETPDNSLWKLARKYDIENKLRQLGKNIALQGEVVGPGINHNTLNLTYLDIYFYDAFDINAYKYYDLNDFKELVENKLKLKTVPVLSYDFTLIDNIDELVKLSIGPSKINPAGPREGIVIRPLKEIYDVVVMPDNNGRISFKVVSPEYLLKYDE